VSTNLWKEIDPYVTYWSEDEVALPVASPIDDHIQPIAKSMTTSQVDIARTQTASSQTAPSPMIPKDYNDRVKQIKYRYIVGRRAGKDLLDPRMQKTIIRKGELITEEVADVAESNGKLVELIMNMVIDHYE